MSIFNKWRQAQGTSAKFIKGAPTGITYLSGPGYSMLHIYIILHLIVTYYYLWARREISHYDTVGVGVDAGVFIVPEFNPDTLMSQFIWQFRNLKYAAKEERKGIRRKNGQKIFLWDPTWSNVIYKQIVTCFFPIKTSLERCF